MAMLQKEMFQYRVSNEPSVVELIEDHKAKSAGLVTYQTKYKTKKQDGEIIDSWYIVTVTHDYTAE